MIKNRGPFSAVLREDPSPTSPPPSERVPIDPPLLANTNQSHQAIIQDHTPASPHVPMTLLLNEPYAKSSQHPQPSSSNYHATQTDHSPPTSYSVSLSASRRPSLSPSSSSVSSRRLSTTSRKSPLPPELKSLPTTSAGSTSDHPSDSNDFSIGIADSVGTSSHHHHPNPSASNHKGKGRANPAIDHQLYSPRRSPQREGGFRVVSGRLGDGYIGAGIRKSRDFSGDSSSRKTGEGGGSEAGLTDMESEVGSDV